MATRVKEDEKNEKIIRTLLKQTPNRRCINCNSLGPQYVCLNFWTFVCTPCSGIHRELQHRVKSISMSKFTSQEVSSLQNGGNEHGRETYFKNWDSQRQTLPENSNVDKLRDFIKSVYVDKRFTGERLPPRVKGADRNENHESRRTESQFDHRAGSRSPPFENNRHDDRRLAGRRSDVGYGDWRRDDRAVGRPDEKRSPGRYETDRNRHERGHNENRHHDERGRYEGRNGPLEDRNKESLDRRFEERFAPERRRPENPPLQRRDYRSASPPTRSVKEILGNDIPRLRVEPSSHSNGHDGDKQGHSQDSGERKFGSSSSVGSENGNPPVKRNNDPESLIDFSVEPEAPAPTGQADPFGLTVVQPSSSSSDSSSLVQSTSTTDSLSNTGWASFESFSASTTAPSVSGAFTDSSHQQTNGNGQWPTGQWNSQQGVGGGAATLPPQSLLGSNTDSWSALGSSPLQTNPAESNQGMLAALAGPTALTAPPVSSADTWPGLGSVTQTIPNNSAQSWSAFPTSTPAPPANPSPPPANPSPPVVQQSLVTLEESNGIKGVNKQRAALPEDLFSMVYPDSGMSNNPMAGAPYSHPHYTSGGLGGFQGQMVPFSQEPGPKSVNPFDIPGDTAALPAGNEFPSLSSLHSALPSLSMGPTPVLAQEGVGFQASFPSLSMGPTSMPPQGGGGLQGLGMGPTSMPSQGGGGLGPQWSQHSLSASQPMSYAPVGPTGGGLSYMSQPTSLPSAMQAGANLFGGGQTNGVTDSMLPNQLTPGVPLQSSSSALEPDAFFNVQGGSGLLSQSSSTASGGLQWGTDLHLGGQQNASLSTNTSLMSGNGVDSFLSFSTNMQQLPVQTSSLGSVGGNPFG